MTAATATPGTKGPTKAPTKEEKTSFLPIQIEEVNRLIVDVWEQTGKIKAMNIKKETLLELANMQKMPLIGVDVIKTKDGLKLYINSEGAKFSREKYLHEQGRRMVGRKVRLMKADQVPGSDPSVDKQARRFYFSVETRVEDVDRINKLVNAIANGTVPAETGMKLIQQFSETYETVSAFSALSESFDAQKFNIEHLIKKGVTQSHRRSDLEISMQFVIEEDEEPVDAQFVVRSAEVLETAKAEATLSERPVTPEKVTKEQEGSKASAAPAAPVTQEVDPAVRAKAKELATLLQTKLDANAIAKWLAENGIPRKVNEMTHEMLDAAIKKATEQFAAPAAPANAPEAAGAAEKPPQEATIEAARKKALARAFAASKGAGFKDTDEVRSWAKQRFGKGLSEMTLQETEQAADTIGAYAKLLEAHKENGFEDAAGFKEAIESIGGDLHQIELTKLPDLVKEVKAIYG